MENTEHPLLIVSLIFGAFAAVIVAGIIRDILKKRREKQKELEYRRNFVRTVTLSDPRFGSIDADFDSFEKTLNAEDAPFPKFGSKAPGSVTADPFQEDMTEELSHTLALVYDQSETVLLGMAEEVLGIFRHYSLTERYTAEEIAEEIAVTEFHFYQDDQLCLQIMAGAEIEEYMFEISAIYRIRSKDWIFEAERVGV